MGATRTEEVITGTAGEGTAERPKNWKEDLKTKKHNYSKDNEGISGYTKKGGETEGHYIRKRM